MRLPPAGTQVIKRERAVKGWSLRTAAAESGLSVGTWQRLENGEEVEYRSLMQAVLALGYASTAADHVAAGLDPERLASGEAYVGQLIAARMGEMGLTEADLAMYTNISMERVERIVNGQAGYPAGSDLRELERVLKWQPGQLDHQYLNTNPDYTAYEAPRLPREPLDADEISRELIELRNRVGAIEERLGIPLDVPPIDAGYELDSAWAAQDGSATAPPGPGSVRPTPGAAPVQQDDA